MGTGRYLDIDDLVIDKEFEELLPVLTIEELEQLENSILKYGLLDPIKIWQDSDTNKWIIIDGHNRYKILKKNNIKWNSCNDYKMLDESELETREDVKRWMLEQQLGRRNLSETEKYEIVQKFKSLFEKHGKENQSAGGKGLSNLSKVNTRKEMAKATGMSEGTYQKLDNIMKSGNEKVKEQLRKKEISIDKAYREIKNSVPKKTESITPEQQIVKLDIRINEIDEQISDLTNERDSLMRRRSSLFEALDIPCELKYEFVEDNDSILSRECKFFIEVNGHREIFVQCMVIDENPNDVYLRKIPDKYKNDFIMIWMKAHKEDVEHDKLKNIEYEKQFKEALIKENDKRKEFYKQCYRVLAKSIHPDNSEGDLEAMQYLNQLKSMWGV